MEHTRTVLFLLSLFLLGTPAHATLVDQSSNVRLNFDLSDAITAPPYTNLILQLSFDTAADDFGPGDGFTMQAFDATATTVSEERTIGPFSTASGGTVEVTFGGPSAAFTGELTTNGAYVDLTNIIGSFDLIATSGRFFSSVDQELERFDGMITTHKVPAPTALSLLSLGLAVLVVSMRKQLGQQSSCISVLLLLFAIAPSAESRAGILLETATLGDTGQTGGSSLSSHQFIGASFELTRTAQISSVGGHLVSSDGNSLFASIVPTSTAHSLPTAYPIELESASLGHSVFSPGFPSSDFRTPLSLTLNAGHYAVVLGTGLFGTLGIGALSVGSLRNL